MKSHYRQMTYASAQSIRARYWHDGWTQARIADAYGVRQNTVSRIVQEIVWIPPLSESWVAHVRDMAEHLRRAKREFSPTKGGRA